MKQKGIRKIKAENKRHNSNKKCFGKNDLLLSMLSVCAMSPN